MNRFFSVILSIYQTEYDDHVVRFERNVDGVSESIDFEASSPLYCHKEILGGIFRQLENDAQNAENAVRALLRDEQDRNIWKEPPSNAS